MAETEMTPRKETERAAKKGREFMSALKGAAEVCEEEEFSFDVMAADLMEFRSRVEGIVVNLEQHIHVGSVG
jgi:hypothetical protein